MNDQATRHGRECKACASMEALGRAYSHQCPPPRHWRSRHGSISATRSLGADVDIRNRMAGSRKRPKRRRTHVIRTGAERGIAFAMSDRSVADEETDGRHASHDDANLKKTEAHRQPSATYGNNCGSAFMVPPRMRRICDRPSGPRLIALKCTDDRPRHHRVIAASESRMAELGMPNMPS